VTVNLGFRRMVVYGGAVLFLLGEAYDTYWHRQHVSFRPEPPSSLWRIHAGIWLGALILVVIGAVLLTRPGARITGAIVGAGGLTSLAGFLGDMALHARGESIDFWHDLVWYGFGVVVIGVVRMEALNRHPPARVPAGRTE